MDNMNCMEVCILASKYKKFQASSRKFILQTKQQQNTCRGRMKLEIKELIEQT